MKSIHRLSLLAAALVLASAAGAQSLTREQVRAELEAARRSGDLVVNGELGLKENELYPGRYPARAQEPGKTRAQVREELAQALRTGDFQVGETGLTQQELRPDLYPMRMASTRTRAEVRAELAEAIANGDIAVGDIGLTEREINPQRYANVKSRTSSDAMASRGSDKVTH
jgi:lambda repressor-like predicted transcriptional regulator